jgi:predicted nicotinamide N-methyase
LAKRFDLLTEAIPVGPLRVQFTRVADPQAVLDQICADIDRHEKTTGQRVKGDQLGLPYWAELWDSAIGIGTWLAKTDWLKPDLILSDQPLKVMDLGCGMGLAGTVAAMLRADVLFADLEPPCLLFALLNGLRYSSAVQARKTNWQTDDLGQRFDRIIGSDVLYDRTQWPFLDTFFRKHLAPGGRILLGEPGRQSGDDYLDWIQDKGWTLVRREQPVPTRSVSIRLLELMNSLS